EAWKPWPAVGGVLATGDGISGVSGRGAAAEIPSLTGTGASSDSGDGNAAEDVSGAGEGPASPCRAEESSVSTPLADTVGSKARGAGTALLRKSSCRTGRSGKATS